MTGRCEPPPSHSISSMVTSLFRLHPWEKGNPVILVMVIQFSEACKFTVVPKLLWAREMVMLLLQHHIFRYTFYSSIHTQHEPNSTSEHGEELMTEELKDLQQQSEVLKAWEEETVEEEEETVATKDMKEML
ncbi:hypothetical protein MHYP_G00087890 [Metynnis hypsauchen]